MGIILLFSQKDLKLWVICSQPPPFPTSHMFLCPPRNCWKSYSPKNVRVVSCKNVRLCTLPSSSNKNNGTVIDGPPPTPLLTMTFVQFLAAMFNKIYHLATQLVSCYRPRYVYRGRIWMLRHDILKSLLILPNPTLKYPPNPFSSSIFFITCYRDRVPWKCSQLMILWPLRRCFFPSSFFKNCPRSEAIPGSDSREKKHLFL